MKETYVDVLIVGAGPSGLMAANALARAGINVRIVDRLPTKIPTGCADGLSPRSLEIFTNYGLGPRLFGDGNQLHMASFYHPTPGGIELIERVPDVAAQSARFQFEMTTHQANIESIFADSMEEHQVRVERPVIPTSIVVTEDAGDAANPQAYAVKVILQHLKLGDSEDAFEAVHAKFVIGADGAHSWVRKAVGLVMEGEQTESSWGVIDILPDTNFPDIRTKAVMHSNIGTCLIIPREEDKARIYVQLDGKNALPVVNGRTDKTGVSPEKLFAIAQEMFRPFTIDKIGDIEWWTIYTIGQRVASSYSIKERVFIVGDACHTHSPKAGQGMNAGIGDSHNLSWKIAYVLRGWAGLALPKTYEFERRKFAQDLISFDKQWSKLFSGKARTEENQDGVSHDHFVSLFNTFSGFTSGCGIHYQPSIIADTRFQHVAKKAIIGQRFPPQQFIIAADAKPVEIQDLLVADTRFNLVVFTGDITTQDKLALLHTQCKKLKGILESFSPGGVVSEVFDFLAIADAQLKKTRNSFLDIPALLRPHWSKVLLDAPDIKGIKGGDGYSNFGVDPATGGIILVRPDGQIATVVSLDDEGIDHLEAIFAGFLARSPAASKVKA